MKVDDDTFVNVPLLYEELTKDEQYRTVKSLLMGNCYCNNPKTIKVVQ